MMTALVVAALPPPGWAQTAGRFEIPDTVSPSAAEALQALYGFRAQAQPADPKGSAERLVAQSAKRRQMIAALGVTQTREIIAGVPAVRIRPVNLRNPRRTLIYLHGGGYTMGSTQGMIFLPALMANQAGADVISVDYTLAPTADWKAITGEVVAVWRALLAKGMDPKSAAVFGDSAGGSLAAGVTLRLRDEGLPPPAALYLVSPWSDISQRGDTYRTLAPLDPLLNLPTLKAAAEAYAHGADLRNPYISPVYGDYAKPFPPTLIQCGTREMFVSNCVRHYQAIRSAGRVAVLDLYEGMPHAFPSVAPDTAETRTAIARAAEFFDLHLARPRPRGR